MRDLMTVIFAAFMVIAPITVLAQVEGGEAASAEISPDQAKRIELATKMHEIRPVDTHIEDMIGRVAERLPEDRREIFTLKMMNAFDKETLNNISIGAMAETFTVNELEAMVEYFGSPEGISVGEKMPVYWALVKPEIAKLVDKAMMDVRLGPKADGGQE